MRRVRRVRRARKGRTAEKEVVYRRDILVVVVVVVKCPAQVLPSSPSFPPSLSLPPRLCSSSMLYTWSTMGHGWRLGEDGVAVAGDEDHVLELGRAPAVAGHVGPLVRPHHRAVRALVEDRLCQGVERTPGQHVVGPWKGAAADAPIVKTMPGCMSRLLSLPACGATPTSSVRAQTRPRILACAQGGRPGVRQWMMIGGV